AAPAVRLPLPHALSQQGRADLRGGRAAPPARRREPLDRLSHPARDAARGAFGAPPDPVRKGPTMTPDPMLLFSREEYARRLEAVRGEMRERCAYVVVVDEAEHLCYLTGFDRSSTPYQARACPLERGW